MTDRPRIAFDRQNPPFAREEWGDLVGFSVAVVRAAYERVGIEAELVPVDGPLTQLILLSAGRVDAAADVTVTERRRQWFAFSHHYHLEELMVFGLTGGPLWSGFRYFHGRLAVKANSYVQEYLIRHYPKLALLPVETTAAALAALRDGRAQGFAHTRESGLALIASGEAADLHAEGVPFGPAPLALAALKDTAERVIAPFDAGLALITRDGMLERLRGDLTPRPPSLQGRG